MHVHHSLLNMKFSAVIGSAALLYVLLMIGLSEGGTAKYLEKKRKNTSCMYS